MVSHNSIRILINLKCIKLSISAHPQNRYHQAARQEEKKYTSNTLSSFSVNCTVNSTCISQDIRLIYKS